MLGTIVHETLALFQWKVQDWDEHVVRKKEFDKNKIKIYSYFSLSKKKLDASEWV